MWKRRSSLRKLDSVDVYPAVCAKEGSGWPSSFLIFNIPITLAILTSNRDVEWLKAMSFETGAFSQPKPTMAPIVISSPYSSLDSSSRLPNGQYEIVSPTSSNHTCLILFYRLPSSGTFQSGFRVQATGGRPARTAQAQLTPRLTVTSLSTSTLLLIPTTSQHIFT